MIDTHQHLLYPDLFRYSWASAVPELQGNHGLEEYKLASDGCGIEGAIFMEVDVDADLSAKEARFFCEMADDPSSKVLGVIAAARPENDGFLPYLDSITHPKVKGLRRVLHTQDDSLSQTSRFRENLSALPSRNLTFDLCVRQNQHALALDLVRACPATTFVLDHFGVPDVAANSAPDGEGFRQWKKSILELGGCPNLHGKISGITVYAKPEQHNAAALQPYWETMLEAFGPSRLVWGGDWPVVNLGTGLSRWCQLTSELLQGLQESDRKAILSENARRIYNL